MKKESKTNLPHQSGEHKHVKPATWNLGTVPQATSKPHAHAADIKHVGSNAHGRKMKGF